ncbi:uncharacterized protein LOC110030256 [Phalaenopsis equestris]|uniref:uncharacterized protein LOC110030256 n=1 Tax=Phalaenopsis equestris TaxID=78828 RepID=UPI0009E5DD6D|nr:uncharacterized protein LOC110030256 [Phalaenopsis equestris]
MPPSPPSGPLLKENIEEDLDMEESTLNALSSGEAVLLGALAPGVNGPTWAVLKITFLMLAICLIAMLSLAFISSDFIIAGHVILLVIIGFVLFVLLNGFLAQTGLVSVEQQIEEMGISQNLRNFKKKKN